MSQLTYTVFAYTLQVVAATYTVADSINIIVCYYAEVIGQEIDHGAGHDLRISISLLSAMTLLLKLSSPRGRLFTQALRASQSYV